MKFCFFAKMRLTLRTDFVHISTEQSCDLGNKYSVWFLNPLTPNETCRGRTAPLTSKVAFNIFIQQI